MDDGELTPPPRAAVGKRMRHPPPGDFMRLLPALALVASALAACATGSGASDPGRYASIVAAPDRSAADRRNDVRRKPVEMLSFIGVRPGMVVLDLFAGGGYTSELLARAVARSGRVYAQMPRPPGATLAARLKTPAAARIVSVA